MEMLYKWSKKRHVAWHAGKSKWKRFKDLNKCSLGIELDNRGHDFGYQNFSKYQIKKLIMLCKILKKYSIKRKFFRSFRYRTFKKN